MAVLSMSKQEFSRLEVLLRVQSGRLRVEDACALVGLHRRQVLRLLRGLKQDGATSLLSKRRGKPSDHRLPSEVHSLALALVGERYADFGSTFAAEKLAELNGCSVSCETLRGWMIADGLWIDRRHRTGHRLSRAANARFTASTGKSAIALVDQVYYPGHRLLALPHGPLHQTGRSSRRRGESLSEEAR